MHETTQSGQVEAPTLTVDLAAFKNPEFNRGASMVKETLWILTSFFLFRLCPAPLSKLKCAVLRLFGARVGRGVMIKPHVKITFPWRLTVGDHVWLGEECWLLNLAPITLGNHVCISQRAFLCTGNHDYSKQAFDLITKPIRVEDGAWLGAGTWVGPGATIGSHAVLAASSVTAGAIPAWSVYRGNPARFIKRRVIRK